MNSYIWTASGKQFHLFRPRPEEVDFEDIAHALSNLCRFTGHTSKFYSVAEHCCLAHDMMVRSGRPGIDGLLHDAAEAYIGDISTPLKTKLWVSFPYADGCDRNVAFVEREIMRAVCTAAGIDYPLDPGVKCIDEQLLEIEIDCLVRPERRESKRVRAVGDWVPEPECWPPIAARDRFVERLKNYI